MYIIMTGTFLTWRDQNFSKGGGAALNLFYHFFLLVTMDYQTASRQGLNQPSKLINFFFYLKIFFF